jgi:hypothetical protein
MAGKTIVALYDDFAEAVRAVHALEEAGFQHEDVSLVANNAENRWSGAHRENSEAARQEGGSQAASGAETGATIGASAGGAAALLASLGVLAVPGVGPVLAAGPIVALITGAGVGAAAGGLIGGLVGLGVPEEEAHAYAEGVRRGGALVTARVPAEQVQRAVAILERHDAVDVAERQAGWRERGWRQFDTGSEPWGVEAIEGERAQWRGAQATTGVGFEETMRSGRIAAEAGSLDAPVAPSTAGMAATSGGTGGAPRVPQAMPGGGSGMSEGARGIGGGSTGAAAMGGGTASADRRNATQATTGEASRPGAGASAPSEAEAALRSGVIRQESDTARMSGGPVPTAMSGMAGSPEGERAQREGLREQKEPLKFHGDSGRRRVRSYESAGGAPGERIDRTMEKAAAGDKPMQADDPDRNGGTDPLAGRK